MDDVQVRIWAVERARELTKRKSTPPGIYTETLEAYVERVVETAKVLEAYVLAKPAA